MKTFMDDFVTMNFQFQTQQIYCVRDRNGAITEGGKVNSVFSNSLYFVIAICTMCKSYAI